ncbi:MAG: DegV family protein [bacterium]
MSRRVRVAVDRTANIEPEIRERLGIEVLPVHITNLPPEMEHLLNQGDYKAFYAFLDNTRVQPQPGTKAGSVYEMRQILEQMITRDDCDIICLVVSAELSAIYDNTMQAAQDLMRKYPNRIAVIGEQAYLSLEILAEATAEFAQTGNSFIQVLEFIEDKRHRAFVWGSLLDLSRLRRSGRVQIPKALTVLLKPFLKTFGILPTFILEGGRPRLTKLMNRSSFARAILNIIRERVGYREPVFIKINYTGVEVPQEALLLKDVLSSQSDFVLVRPIQITRASPVVGVHAGSSLVGLGVVGLGYESITTQVLLRFFTEAQNELKTFRRAVNAINVFPVRDGDTGSNLLSPLLGITEGIEPNLPLPLALNQIVTRIARCGGGYSGGALSAYFLGFNACVQEQNRCELNLKILVQAFTRGTDRCYEYFGDDAKEGTILSVMRACERAANQAFETNPSFRNVLTQAYLAATEELLNPRVQEVEVLRQERMVDAGGFGFTLLLWALLRTLGLHRESRLQERYRLILQEVRRHAELGQRLIYRRQPEELRGFCVEGCVFGEVAKQLRAEFERLGNRLPNPKMTFNIIDNTTHFHIHISEGLEGEVQRIAAGFGYALPPKPPTRLAKRRREIYQFRFINLLRGLKRVPGYIATFLANWVLYALFFPVMWARQHHLLKRLQKESANLQLIRLAFSFITRNDNSLILVLDALGNVVYNSNSIRIETLGCVFPLEVVKALKLKMEEMSASHQPSAQLIVTDQASNLAVGPDSQPAILAGNWCFEIQLLSGAGQKGYLIKYILPPER